MAYLAQVGFQVWSQVNGNGNNYRLLAIIFGTVDWHLIHCSKSLLTLGGSICFYQFPIGFGYSSLDFCLGFLGIVSCFTHFHLGIRAHVTCTFFEIHRIIYCR
ncbi:hypothetical protein V1477_017879 [Vespula maculifrons]|uniref:Uncharacterized protein n=1 Tax=Vespula maculifrons TaxID=7453 RepID=A0ABD2B1B7_VESMC